MTRRNRNRPVKLPEFPKPLETHVLTPSTGSYDFLRDQAVKIKGEHLQQKRRLFKAESQVDAAAELAQDAEERYVRDLAQRRLILDAISAVPRKGPLDVLAHIRRHLTIRRLSTELKSAQKSIVVAAALLQERTDSLETARQTLEELPALKRDTDVEDKVLGLISSAHKSLGPKAKPTTGRS